MASVPGRWQQCLDCHGGHLQDVVLKTGGFFCEAKTLTYLTVFSCIYCCVQQMCYPTFKMGNVKCRTLYIYVLHYFLLICDDEFPTHYKILNCTVRSLLLVNFTWLISISVLRLPDWGRFVLLHVSGPAALFASPPPLPTPVSTLHTHSTYTHYVSPPRIKGSPENQLQRLKCPWYRLTRRKLVPCKTESL